MGDSAGDGTDHTTGAERPTTRDRIRTAARVVVSQKGFAATVDEIAVEAGVSPRTVFRHYATRDELIVDAVKAMFEAAGARPIPGLPTAADDLDGWIEGLAATIHTRNAEIVGQAFWDIHAPQSSETLGEIQTIREQYRVRGVRHLVDTAWGAAGGRGAPPAPLFWAFGLNFSAFTTQALMIDFGLTPEQIGAVTADILKSALAGAVRRQPPAHAPDGEDQPPTANS